MSLFVKVTNEDGTETYVPAPEEVVVRTVKDHSEFKKVLTESITRKDRIKELEGKVSAPVMTEPVAPIEQKTEQPVFDAESFAKQVAEKVKQELAEAALREAEAARKRKEAIDNAIMAHNLKDNEHVRRVLGGVENPSEMAETLARAGLQLAVPRGGEAPTSSEDIVKFLVSKAKQ